MSRPPKPVSVLKRPMGASESSLIRPPRTSRPGPGDCPPDMSRETVKSEPSQPGRWRQCLAGPYARGHAATAEKRARSRDLSRDLSGQPQVRRVHRRPRPPEFPLVPRRRRPTTSVAVSQLLPHDEPLPCPRRDARAEPRDRNASPEREPRSALQSTLGSQRTSVSGQIPQRRRRERDPPPRTLALHRLEPGPRRRLQLAGGLAVEQLRRNHRKRQRAVVPRAGRASSLLRP